MKNIKIFLNNLNEITFYVFYFCSLLFFLNIIFFNNYALQEILNYPLFIIFALMIESQILKKIEYINSTTLNKLAILNIFVILFLLIIDITN